MARSFSQRKVQQWREVLRRFHASGLSVAGFCRQEQIAQASFYLWRKRLAQPAAAKEPVASAFRSVRVLPASGVTVQLRGGTQIMVPESNPQALRTVIDALARVDSEIAGGVASC